MKISVYIATSVDGFIARNDGAVDWLSNAEDQPESAAEDYGYHAFIESVDALVMGRHTFEKILSFGQWPYGEKSVILLSQSLTSLPEGSPESVQLKSRSPEVIYKALKESGYQHIYVDGGTTIQRFLRAGLVNELIITTIPMLIGSGISLFGELEKDIKLRLVQSKSFENGLVQNHYKVRQ